MTTPITTADLLAICDVADRLAEQAGDQTAEQAIRLIEAVDVAVNALQAAKTLLRSQAISNMEQPIVVDNVAYSKVLDLKKRPQHAIIRKAVISQASQPDENGEVPTVVDVAERVYDTMVALYVAPSTVPKVGGVKMLGLNFGDVIVEEHTGWTLTKTVLP